jgi:Tol biopolymer transport system component
MRVASGVAVGSPTYRLAAITLSSLALLVALGAAVAGGVALLDADQTRTLPLPYGPARNGSIIFGKDGDILVADADGANTSPLIVGPESDIYPLYSPDGMRFIFERVVSDQPRRVMVANADGTAVSRVADVSGFTEDWTWTDWSPDGQHLAVLWGVDGAPAISILSIDGSEPVNLDLGDLSPTEFVAWRPPDGAEIVFAADRNGVAPRGLYAIRPDGTGLRTIAVSTDLACQDCPFQEPTLSPDGSQMAFWSWEENEAGIAGGRLHVLDFDGSDRVVSLDPAYPESGYKPRFSPDGRSLLFETGPHDQAGMDLVASGGHVSQLVLAPVDGSTPARPMGPWYTDDQQTPEFSPDGTAILQDRGPGGSWMIDVASGEAVQTPDYLLAPSWQRLAP